MKSVSKKYFSISELSEITGILLHRLRYLEKSKTDIDIVQICGRRYDASTNIESIKHFFNRDNELQFNLFSPIADDFAKSNNQLEVFPQVVDQIDLLISKFTKLEKDIIKTL
jgi:hypothetical protein